MNESARVLETVTTTTAAVNQATGHAPLGQHETALPDKPVVLNDAQAASAAFNLRDLWAYRELLYFLAWRDVRVRYKQTVMGTAWAIIQPLLFVIIFAVFFGIFMRVPTDGITFIVFFYCGMMPWTFFSTALALSSGSLINNSNLITKIYFPRAIIPIASVSAGLVDLLITTVILLALMPYYHIHVTRHLVMLPALLALTVLLSMTFSVWLAALTVKYRDVRHALPFVLQIWMFVTPIIYPMSVVSPRWHWLMYLNPLTGIVEGVRAAVTGRSFNWPAIACSVVIAFLSLFASVYAFRRIDKSFADLL